MPRTNLSVAIGFIAAVLLVGSLPHAQERSAAASGASNSRVAITRALPPLDGSHLQGTIVEVSYAPGGSSAAHSHPCAVLGYVVSGAVRMQVKGEPAAIYKAGDTFYEAPNGVHQVSANASATEPAKIIAVFTCDRQTPLSVPPPDER
jgi:quercetin dioxygenase-like cupin family protein